MFSGSDFYVVLGCSGLAQALSETLPTKWGRFGALTRYLDPASNAIPILAPKVAASKNAEESFLTYNSQRGVLNAVAAPCIVENNI